MNLEKFTNLLLNYISKTKKIVLYVHVTPDCDAIGSAFAMLNFIKFNYKNKDVRIAGLNKLNTSYLPPFFQNQYQEVDENFVKDAMSIVFDTANYERIYDKQFFNKKNSFRIDHHLFIKEICEYELINEDASSTCELVSLIFKHSKLKLNSITANSLYFGILTDTIRFLTPNTNSNTYLVMNWLESKKILNKKLVHDQLYLRSLADVKFDKKISRYIKYKNHYALMIIDKHKIKKINPNELKNKMYLLSGLEEIYIYGIIYYDATTNVYKGSLRSRDYNVNLIAKKFTGGGHKYASGLKLNNKKDIKALEIEIQKNLLLKDKYE